MTDRLGRGLLGLTPRAQQVTLARDHRAEDPAGYVAALHAFVVDAHEKVRMPDQSWCRP